MNRLNNVTVSEVKELKIDRPPMIPDEELALRNRKTVAEIKKNGMETRDKGMSPSSYKI
jgi:hypothetical protein